MLTTRSSKKGSSSISRIRGNNRARSQGKNRILQGREHVGTVERIMRLINAERLQVLVSDVEHWIMQSRSAPFYRIRPIGINNQDKQLLKTNHQFRTGLGNLNISSNKADYKVRIRLLVLPSKIGMRKGDQIRHRTGHRSKGGHIISTVWMQKPQET